MGERRYQYEFSAGNDEMHSLTGRERKAKTMLAILTEALNEQLAQARVLNVGCSTGIIDRFLAPHVATVTGIDIDVSAITSARACSNVPNANFYIGDAMHLDFRDASFDVVVCAQVYEHVSDPAQMMAEILRVLAPGGVCYFAATNRFCIMEQHYHLPFLSIIPVPMAHIYLRLAARGKYYHERHLSVWGLRRLVREFEVNDYTHKILSDPDRYSARYMLGSGIKLWIARTVARIAYGVFPGYVWILAPKRRRQLRRNTIGGIR